MKKEDNIKEQFKRALISTIKVISDDYKLKTDLKKNLSSKNFNFFELNNLNSKEDFIKLRAETDSEALKRKFSNKKIYQKNLPRNSFCRSLYDITETIRYELLGSKMLKGISKNLNKNYNYKINLKRKDQLKTKDDVNIAEAFELYMLKNFFKIKLNTLSTKILSFWEKEFTNYLGKHLNYLNNNLENQEIYNSKFSELLQDMQIFDNENDDQKNEDQQNEQDNNPGSDSENQSQGEQEKNPQEESQNGMDSDYDFSDLKLDEQLVDTESEKQSSEQVIQKLNSGISDKDYKVYTKKFDEISKAESLESSEEISKLRNFNPGKILKFLKLELSFPGRY